MASRLKALMITVSNFRTYTVFFLGGGGGGVYAHNPYFGFQDPNPAIPKP